MVDIIRRIFRGIFFKFIKEYFFEVVIYKIYLIVFENVYSENY